jgi:PHP family Zn ribbon phosphoesterase
MASKQVHPFQYVLPLPEILAEIIGYSEESLKIKAAYSKAISFFGNEFDILHQVPVENIERFNYKLSIAIQRLRNNQKHFIAGYDGKYGRISFFNEGELNEKAEQMTLF